jgi:hypothetical protein
MTQIKIKIFDYLLQGYSDSIRLENGKEYKTINMKESDTCGLIKVIDGPDREINEIRSCDVLESQIKKCDHDEKLGIDDISQDSNLYFELNYKMGKITSSDLVNFINVNGAKKVNVETVNMVDVTENIKKLYTSEILNSITRDVLSELKKGYPDAKKHTENNTFIQWVKPDFGDNIILFGDIHGSFSTLVRHILRFRKLNIINRKGTIANGYKIIFLGDVVDRGLYSLETLILLYLLKINNGEKVILNRGNHEELETNRIKIELDHKLENSEQVYETLSEIMTWQPSAIVIENSLNEDEYVYLAHGALPHDMKDNDKLPQEFVDGFSTKSSFIISEEYAKSIRWNDVHGHDETTNNCRRINPSTPVDDKVHDLIKIIGRNLITEANKMGIKMIIRGHQDSGHNTKIIKKDTNEWISIKKSINKNMKCRGPIYTVGLQEDELTINGENQDQVLPILTISTNTDKDRNLTSDSYAILQFTDEDQMNECFVGGSSCKYRRQFYKYNNKLQELFSKVGKLA